LTAIVLQARIDSSRLPGKALLLLDGEPLIFRVMEALNHVKAGVRILACTEDSFYEFEPLAKKAGFQIYAGPKDDVLERYCQVIRKFRITRVIRATGDNPFVFADASDAINNEASSLNADYAGFLNLPYGAGVESAAASALLRAADEASQTSEREHVCPYLYNNPGIFKLHRPPAPSQWHHPQLRITVDTREDYDRALALYSALKNENNRYNGSVIISAYNRIFKPENDSSNGEN